MLTLVTVATFLLELCSSSPVYNMQPAFITANIGTTTGRNIRNLPCISRKNNQSGVCMFAIDCLKSNGTHLGTCIDRFYFGSCCHIEPIHDIIENTIDTDIIPHREPPFRVSSTTAKPGTAVQILNKVAVNASASTDKMTTDKMTTDKMTIDKMTTDKVTTDKMTTDKMTTDKMTTYKVTTDKGTTNKMTTDKITTEKMTTQKVAGERTTTMKTSATTVTTTSPPVTGSSEKLQTFQSVNGLLESTTSASTTTTTTATTTTTSKPVVTTTTVGKPITRPTLKPSRPTLTTTPKTVTTTATATTTRRPVTTTVKPSRTTTKVVTTTPKITRPVTTTIRPSRPVTTNRPVTTIRPVTTTVKPVKATKPTLKPTKVTVKPTKTTVTTRRPPLTTLTTTKRPIVTKTTTKKPIILTKPTRKVVTTTVPPTTTAIRTTTRPTIGTTRPTSRTTTRPTTRTTTRPTTRTTTRPTITRTTTTAPTTTRVITKAPTTTQHVTTATVKPTTTVTTSQATVINDVPLAKLNVTSILETVNGNPATNEIEAAKPATTEKTTSKPSLVTWTVADERKNVTTTNMPVGNTTMKPEDWVPITTPDGWVLLPSVSAAVPVVAETTEQPSMSSMTVATTTATPDEPSQSSSTPPKTTSSKPSITYIPLQPSTTGLPLVTAFTTSPTQSSTTSSSTDVPTSTPDNLSSTTISTTSSPDTKPVNMSDFTDVCGRRMYPEARIVGGEKSSFGKWPWQISLRQWRTSTYLHKCGAALLNENWAITAAHCVDNVPPSDLLLRLGEHDLSTESEPYLHQERRVQIVASHPQFDPRTFEYDLALLRFYEPVNFQPNILPVCVPQTDENFVGRTAYVTGWGRLYEDGPLPSILQEVSVPVINNSVCESMYRSAGYIEHIPHIFICAGWRRGGFDSCEGDSGGPMVIQREDKRFLLAGVISWGIGCAEPNQPGVYTRISEFRDWINQILQF